MVVRNLCQVHPYHDHGVDEDDGDGDDYDDGNDDGLTSGMVQHS